MPFIAAVFCGMLKVGVIFIVLLSHSGHFCTDFQFIVI